MTDLIGDELASVLVAEISRGFPLGDLLSHALSDEPPDAGAWARLFETGLSDVAVAAALDGFGLGADVLATLFRGGGSVLLPLAAQEQAIVLAPVLGALADGSARVAELLAGVRAGSVVGGGGGVVDAAGLRVDDESVVLDGVGVWTGPGASVVAVVGPEVTVVLDLPPAPVVSAPSVALDAGQGLRLLTGPVARVDALVLEGAEARRIWQRWQLALLAHVLGVADAVLDQATGYAKERSQFGRPIGSFQAVSHPLADAHVSVTAGESALARLAALLDAPADAAAGVDEVLAGLACWLPAKARLVCEQAMQVHGGIGFTWEHGLHLFYRRALTIQALLGGRVGAARRVQGVHGAAEDRS